MQTVRGRRYWLGESDSRAERKRMSGGLEVDIYDVSGRVVRYFCSSGLTKGGRMNLHTGMKPNVKPCLQQMVYVRGLTGPVCGVDTGGHRSPDVIPSSFANAAKGSAANAAKGSVSFL